MNLFSKIDDAMPKIRHGWCSVPKAYTLASSVLALRPDVTIEIGVWGGKSLIPLALAHKEIGKGIVVGIDPWTPAASVEGQVNDADKKHWGTTDHESVYQEFLGLLKTFQIDQCVRVHRMKSDECPRYEGVSLLHIDGNHGPQAIKDVEKFAPMCRSGALLVADDLGWSGGFVTQAMQKLEGMGWAKLYALDQGAVYQRV